MERIEQKEDEAILIGEFNSDEVLIGQKRRMRTDCVYIEKQSIPALIEALALSFADNTDAKIQTFMEALDSKDETGWLGYNKMIESNIRRSTK